MKNLLLRCYKMDEKDILKLERLVVETNRVKKIITNVMHVQKCNFNDTYYVKENIMNVDEIKDQPLKWFNPYLGLSKDSQIEIAVAYITDEAIYYLEKDGTKIQVVEKELYLDYICCEDLDDRLLLASHTRIG